MENFDPVWRGLVVPSGGSNIPQRAQTPEGVRANLLFCKSFAENCTKMKEFGLRIGPSSLASPGSATGVPGRMWGRLTTGFLQLRIEDFKYRLGGVPSHEFGAKPIIRQDFCQKTA